jgi:cytosine deaminase
MYTTLAPCDMCTGAILLYDIPRVVVGENRTYVGAVVLLRSRGVEVIVADSAKCIAMMESFISDNPALWDEDIGE